MKSTPWFIGGIVLIIGVAGVAFLYAPEKSDADIAKETERIVTFCAQTDDHQKCYEQEVPVLYGAYAIPDLFEIIRRIRTADPTYQFCHVLAHKLGEAVVAENPDAWMDAIPLNPADGMCSNGFIHGVVGGRFRAEVLDDATLASLKPDFSRACEARDDWQPSPLDQAICYHGMGHLYMFITDAEVRKALSVCEETTDPPGNPDFRQVCREGVFMQIYQPLEPDDFLMLERMTVKPSTTTVRQFCALYSDRTEYEGACLRESWPFFRKEVVSGTGVGQFCSEQPNTVEEENCYHSATAIIGRMSLGKPERAARACEHLPDTWRHLCFATAATAVIEESRDAAEAAISLCGRAPSDVAQRCLRTLASRAHFVFGADESRKQAFCGEMPREWQAECSRIEIGL